MKTKTRKIIGKILVWGGLAIEGLIAYVLYDNLMTLKSGTYLMLTPFAWSLIAIVALLVGGLWGTRK